MRIAVDMDEVIADTHAAQRAAYAQAGFTASDADLHGKHLRDLAPPDTVRQVQLQMSEGTFFANLDVIAGAVDAMADLYATHEVFIATAAMDYPASCAHKIAWLARHFPFIAKDRIVLCGDKSIIKADVLIDDHSRHFTHFAGQGVLFDALHNKTTDWPHRLTDWADVHTTLERIAR
ncbi:5'(3')-deoxyribonucleotidase [Loktanella sp. DSM 29012]|uniref:5' nucleotidase, NT5C type n=1 Tax=Loktanella sp. DSM 29012 TaxID=1881056 RepID=UPI0008CAD143|nr:hypothetical protein [Loktanella sp. DSM 29012]SEQ22425.1 5'(3')-deoxyribonucleotidase [Loktanella sp. DSM 29012]